MLKQVKVSLSAFVALAIDQVRDFFHQEVQRRASKRVYPPLRLELLEDRVVPASYTDN